MNENTLKIDYIINMCLQKAMSLWTLVWIYFNWVKHIIITINNNVHNYSYHIFLKIIISLDRRSSIMFTKVHTLHFGCKITVESVLVPYCGCQEMSRISPSKHSDGPITEQQIDIVGLGPPYLFCLGQHSYLEISWVKKRLL